MLRRATSARAGASATSSTPASRKAAVPAASPTVASASRHARSPSRSDRSPRGSSSSHSPSPASPSPVSPRTRPSSASTTTTTTTSTRLTFPTASSAAKRVPSAVSVSTSSVVARSSDNLKTKPLKADGPQFARSSRHSLSSSMYGHSSGDEAYEMDEAKQPTATKARGRDIAQRVVELMMIKEWKARVMPKSESWPCFDLVSVEDVMNLCTLVQRRLAQEPVCVDMPAPCKVFGDLFGQIGDLLDFFATFGKPNKLNGDIGFVNYLFLGNYVDRGRYSLEVMTLLLAVKLLYPDQVCLLRGSHEVSQVNEKYGFLAECQKRLGDDVGHRVWEKFNETFEWFPLACRLQGEIFCVHAGVGGSLQKVRQLESLEKPILVPGHFSSLSEKDRLVADILWSDPTESDKMLGVHKNEKYPGQEFVKFGPDRVEAFLRENNFKMIVRGHECVDRCAGFDFSGEGKVLTLFTATMYGGRFPTCGGILDVHFNHGQLHMRACVLEPTHTSTSIPYVWKIDLDRPVTPPRGHEFDTPRSMELSDQSSYAFRKPSESPHSVQGVDSHAVVISSPSSPDHSHHGNSLLMSPTSSSRSRSGRKFVSYELQYPPVVLQRRHLEPKASPPTKSDNSSASSSMSSMTTTSSALYHHNGTLNSTSSTATANSQFASPQSVASSDSVLLSSPPPATEVIVLPKSSSGRYGTLTKANFAGFDSPGKDSTGSLGSDSSFLMNSNSTELNLLLNFLSEAGITVDVIREARTMFRAACQEEDSGKRTRELYLDEDSLTHVLVKFGVNHRYCRQYYKAFDPKQAGRVSFYDFLIGLVALDPSTPHKRMSITGEVRIGCIFHAYRPRGADYIEFHGLRHMLRHIYRAKHDEISSDEIEDRVLDVLEEMRKLVHCEDQETFSLEEFKEAVNKRVIRGTTHVFRLPHSPFLTRMAPASISARVPMSQLARSKSEVEGTSTKTHKPMPPPSPRAQAFYKERRSTTRPSSMSQEVLESEDVLPPRPGTYPMSVSQSALSLPLHQLTGSPGPMVSPRASLGQPALSPRGSLGQPLVSPRGSLGQPLVSPRGSFNAALAPLVSPRSSTSSRALPPPPGNPLPAAPPLSPRTSAASALAQQLSPRGGPAPVSPRLSRNGQSSPSSKVPEYIVPPSPRDDAGSGDGVFGRLLSELDRDEYRDGILIPKPLKQLYAFMVASRAFGQDRIFEIVPNDEQVSRIRERIEKRAKRLACDSVYVAASLIKEFFAELPKKLFPLSSSELLALQVSSESKCVEVLDQLSPPYLDLCYFLLDICGEVAANVASSNMDCAALATVFAPLLVQFDSSMATETLMKATAKLISLFTKLIQWRARTKYNAVVQ